MMKIKLATLSDSSGKITGSGEVLAVHRHPAQLHLAVSVWLVRGKGENLEILLQKRSSKKIVGAHQWANAICGNVRPDEDFAGCASRRLREEIGVTGVQLQPLYQFEYQAFCNETFGEHEFDQVYVGNYEGDFALNPDEVEAVAWVNFAALMKELAGVKIPAASETLGVSTADLKDITLPQVVEIDDHSYEIAPWTVLMLGDERLLQNLRNY